MNFPKCCLNVVNGVRSYALNVAKLNFLKGFEEIDITDDILNISRYRSLSKYQPICSFEMNFIKKNLP